MKSSHKPRPSCGSIATGPCGWGCNPWESSPESFLKILTVDDTQVNGGLLEGTLLAMSFRAISAADHDSSQAPEPRAAEFADEEAMRPAALAAPGSEAPCFDPPGIMPLVQPDDFFDQLRIFALSLLAQKEEITSVTGAGHPRSYSRTAIAVTLEKTLIGTRIGT